MKDFKEFLEKINTRYQELSRMCTAENCWKLSVLLQDAETFLRESIQVATRPEIQRIVDKLKSQQELSAAEKEHVKLWIVGDADYYVKVENNYQEWIAEIDRLIARMNDFKGQDIDVISASRLRAKLTDAMRTLGDIMFFLGEKQRVEAFVEATQVLDSQERALLVDLLEHKMFSPKF